MSLTPLFFYVYGEGGFRLELFMILLMLFLSAIFVYAFTLILNMLTQYFKLLYYGVQVIRIYL